MSRAIWLAPAAVSNLGIWTKHAWSRSSWRVWGTVMQRREGHGRKGLSLWATIKSVQEWSKGRRWLKDRKSRTQETEEYSLSPNSDPVFSLGPCPNRDAQRDLLRSGGLESLSPISFGIWHTQENSPLHTWFSSFSTNHMFFASLNAHTRCWEERPGAD